MFAKLVFSERELAFTLYMLSPVCLLVMLVYPTQVVVIFGNISMVLGTSAILHLYSAVGAEDAEVLVAVCVVKSVV